VLVYVTRVFGYTNHDNAIIYVFGTAPSVSQTGNKVDFIFYAFIYNLTRRTILQIEKPNRLLVQTNRILGLVGQRILILIGIAAQGVAGTLAG